METCTMWNKMIEIMKQDIKPATGCTEPISLAFAAATAAKELGEPVQAVKAFVSANLMKNGMGVMVPGTGMPGLAIAAAVGALGGDANAGLQVLKSLTPDVVAQGKQMVADGKVTVGVNETTKHILYSEANVYGESHHVRAVIVDNHTNVVLIEKDGQVIFEKKASCNDSEADKITFLQSLSIKDILKFAENTPLANIQFIKNAENLNDALSKEGLTGKYGLRIGCTMEKHIKDGLLAGDLAREIQVRTVAASDARMGGAACPAMTNSGSGNQGITVSEPVTVVADHIKASGEERVRALALASMVAIYAHSYLPKLSAFCATVTAAMGAAAGMAWLLDRKTPYQTICKAISSMNGGIIGMVCDGAADSCAMKVASAAEIAYRSVLMALDGIRVEGTDGLVANTADECIRNVGLLASNGMQQTDCEVLHIMMNKNKEAAGA
ncbi:serine dehydratase subunit alpha family protein [Megasphaera sp.]|uniref:L-cysteine desulfidase family protein n=1 Tax=Megasphaera sp. TaxID=2023260 RepID=UPI003A90FFC9